MRNLFILVDELIYKTYTVISRARYSLESQLVLLVAAIYSANGIIAL